MPGQHRMIFSARREAGKETKNEKKRFKGNTFINYNNIMKAAQVRPTKQNKQKKREN